MLIRPEEMKHIIKTLPVIKAARDSIKAELERLVENIDDSIYSACMNGSGSGGGIPSTGSVSDKTGEIALKIRHSNRADIKQLQNDLNLLQSIIDSIDSGMKVLTYNQKLIISLYYKENGKGIWKEVIRGLKEKEIFFNERHIRRIFEYGIRQMITATQVTIETYKEVIEIMNGRGG